MPQKAISSYCGVLSLALLVAVTATPAFAGFQWTERTPSEIPPTASVISSSVQAPAGEPVTNQPEYISPLIIGGPGDAKAFAAAPAPAPGPVPVQDLAQQTAPVQPAPMAVAGPVEPLPPPPPPPGSKNDIRTDLMTVSISPLSHVSSKAQEKKPVNLASETISTPAPALPGDNEIVQGFASRVPLVLAVRQILPAGYNFAVDPGVSPDTLVSYKGGKPWGETLRSTLAAADLDYRQEGKLITVRRRPQVLMPALQAARPAAPASRFHSLSSRGGLSASDGWTAERGDSLRKVLVRWCARANVELKWISEYDYPVEASAKFNGGFESAVRNLLAGFDAARPQPIGELHINQQAGQNVLVVQARGNSYTN